MFFNFNWNWIRQREFVFSRDIHEVSFWPLVFLANKIKQISNARRWSSGKSRYAQSELLMGEDDHRSELAFVDTEKDLGVTFSLWNLSTISKFKSTKTREFSASWRDHLDIGPWTPVGPSTALMNGPSWNMPQLSGPLTVRKKPDCWEGAEESYQTIAIKIL